MQERHKNRSQYFQELAQASRKYFIPYIQQFKELDKGCRILEIGCGDGGNLLPFAQMGCYTLGVDIAEGRIADARKFFMDCGTKGNFIASDVFLLKELQGTLPLATFSRLDIESKLSCSLGLTKKFDVIICHDVIEHILDKQRFLSLLPQFLAMGGIIFMSFPAWQMPFGGHQQICRNKFTSHLPFIHLLPTPLYRLLLKASGEDYACIKELMSIRETRTPVELFEQALKVTDSLTVEDRTLWLINPHYESKFGLRPRLLPKWIGRLPYVRNFFTSSCFYIITTK